MGDDQWPDQVFGDFHKSFEECLKEVDDEEDHIASFAPFGCALPSTILMATQGLLWVELFVVLFFFVCLDGLEPAKELKERSVAAAIEAMSSNFAQLNMTVPPLYKRNS